MMITKLPEKALQIDPVIGMDTFFMKSKERVPK